MLNYCRHCGSYRVDKIISEDGKKMKCPVCGFMQELKRKQLFIITGASGVGKSSLCIELFKNEEDYIVMESDILWNDAFNNPEDDYKEYRELWLRMCKNISQGGKSVVLCGCSVPKQFENCLERRYFSTIHYLAVICDDETLENRLRKGRNVECEDWINSSIAFNKWLKENATKTSPNIKLLDTTNLNIKEAACVVDTWIHKSLAREMQK